MGRTTALEELVRNKVKHIGASSAAAGAMEVTLARGTAWRL